jgi:hypothetical protein
MECQRHENYQESVTWLMSFIEEYVKHGRKIAGARKDHTADSVTKDKNLKRATRELRTLLERFANNTSLDIVLDAIDAIIDDARRDEELRAWFSDVDAYIRKLLLEPGYVIEPDCNNQANRLRESGRRFYDDKYKGHFDNLFNSMGTWFKAFGEDEVWLFPTWRLFAHVFCNSSISSLAKTGHA